MGPIASLGRTTSALPVESVASVIAVVPPPPVVPILMAPAPVGVRVSVFVPDELILPAPVNISESISSTVPSTDTDPELPALLIVSKPSASTEKALLVPDANVVDASRAPVTLVASCSSIVPVELRII